MYVINRDAKASIRLNYQHALIAKLTSGHLLHRTVRERLDLTAPIRVADIGAGTAIWPTDLATSLGKTCRIDAFDISAEQYPIRAWQSPNIVLHQQDAFQPYPVEHHGVYDVVNLRFFMTLMGEEKVRPLLDNVRSLLKPGGFFQWLDLEPRLVQAIAADANTPHPRTQEVATMMQRTPPDVDSWLSTDSSILENAGFEPVAYNLVRLEDPYRPLWNHCLLMGLEEFASKQEQKAAEAMRQTVVQLGEEFQQGACVDVQFFYMVGRMS